MAEIETSAGDFYEDYQPKTPDESDKSKQSTSQDKAQIRSPNKPTNGELSDSELE
ncbi:hypothetical protein [Vibrio gangliei]|uniref:hypothetical protein n=1 Tax=Vibrio gangliei TaxID=2077090 RepID=UPI0013005425|nr:hypothetical protein [Vibrio gangliei]